LGRWQRRSYQRLRGRGRGAHCGGHSDDDRRFLCGGYSDTDLFLCGGCSDDDRFLCGQEKADALTISTLTFWTSWDFLPFPTLFPFR
jgi:hypothetical protein